MKICMIGPTYPFRGGISHYTTLLHKHLKNRHEVYFFAFKRQYPKILFPGKTDIDTSKEAFSEEGVLPILDSMNPFTWLRTAKAIRGKRPDIVIIPWWVSFWAPQFWSISVILKCFSRSKVLFLCHNVVEHESKWIDKCLTKVVLGKGDYYIVHSSEDQKNLLAMFPDAKIRKSFHPTYDVFNLGHCDPDIIRKKYGIEGNIILFFGFIREYKGLKILIRALPEVLSKIDLTLFIVGEFWKDKDDYLELIDELEVKDNIIMVDEYVPNEEVGLYFSAADLVVQPYITATGSGVIQTAYGFDKPVIATNVGSLPEVVEDGKTGFIVPPGSYHALAKAIVSFFHEKKGELFSEMIAKEKYKFSWDRMVDVIEDLVLSE